MFAEPWIPDPDKILWFDLEVFSELALPRIGVFRNATHPSTRVVMAQWALGPGEVNLWDCYYNPDPADYRIWIDLLRDPQYLIGCFNAPYERRILHLNVGLELPWDRFYCIQHHSYCLSFAGSLEEVGAQVGLDESIAKLKDGKRVMLKFTAPRTPSQSDPSPLWTPWNAPEDWRTFRAYGRNDITSQRGIHDAYLRDHPIDAIERQIWIDHCEMNSKGIPVDSQLVDNAITIKQQIRARVAAELEALTGLDNVNSRDQMLNWLNTRDPGYHIGDLQAKTVEQHLDAVIPGQPPEAREALELWQQKSKTSVDKFDAIARTVYEGTVRDTLKIAGASRTRRDAGAGVQPQNLVRGRLKDADAEAPLLSAGRWDAISKGLYPDVKEMELLSWFIRSSFAAPEGKLFVDADLSSIESVVVGWLTNCRSLIDTFAQGLDSYKVFASDYYCVPYERVTPAQRFFCKPPTLGAAYRMWAPALVKYAVGMGVGMDESEAKAMILLFRDRNEEICRAWEWYDAALPHIAAEPPGTVVEGYRARYERIEDFLVIHLPTGREIFYHKPEAYWDGRRERWAWSYMGRNSYTRKWERIPSHGGVVIENKVQAIARDLLYRHAFPRMMKAGIDVRLLVHDQAVAVAWEEEADAQLELLIRCLTDKPDLPDVDDLHLGAEGVLRKHFAK